MVQKCDINFECPMADYDLFTDIIPRIIGTKSHNVVKVQVSKGMKHDCDLERKGCDKKASLRIIRKTNKGKFYANHVCHHCFKKEIYDWVDRKMDRIREELKEQNSQTIVKHQL